MASLYIIAIGGTGAKCAEAIVHAVAAGLFTPKSSGNSKVKIFFVDPDEANGNVAHAMETIKIYQNCYNLFQDSTSEDEQGQLPWMSLPIESKNLWSPFSAGNKTLIDFFNHASYKETPLGSLLEALYTEGEQTNNLDVGFRGRPAIGSAVLSQVNFSQNPDEFWQRFIDEVKQDFNSGTPKIFLCGSIFGGTGAAGFPTIGKLLRNELKRIKGLDKAVLGGLLMLPYFQFNVPPSQSQEEIYARSEDFLLKTEAAMRYYLGQAEETFNLIYLLGDRELVEVGNFSIGQADQQNPPHFLELYAALAARHFWLTEEPGEDRGRVALMARHQQGEIRWNDIPQQEPNEGNTLDAQAALIAMTRFAFAWTAGVTLDLKDALDLGIGKFQRGADWFSLFFRPETWLGWGRDEVLPELKPEMDKILTIDRWCENYLTWLALIHYAQASSDSFKLFQANRFAHRDGQLRKQIEEFPDLVFDPNADRTRQARDTYREITLSLTKDLKNKLGSPNVGALGLAKALYLLCGLK